MEISLFRDKSSAELQVHLVELRKDLIKSLFKSRVNRTSDGNVVNIKRNIARIMSVLSERAREGGLGNV